MNNQAQVSRGRHKLQEPLRREETGKLQGAATDKLDASHELMKPKQLFDWLAGRHTRQNYLQTDDDLNFSTIFCAAHLFTFRAFTLLTVYIT